ncbi:ATP synthase F0 subcomplex B subunit [Austwickia chelonae]|uniref:ATP synthase subunit b n=1 Tax=Austwickia chelonae NBRC 105200 TaxID=1184607 RepID=K6V3P3_9MICO|nr:F0F1 ATP synthase subunit B [Austwickia chelonae]GAB76713.1 ATP synthase subunit b [Austwickia chelonae NBRC 105200]SEW29675.1 ATP synthase F0 subcomplex B subunit [Austwickia chelonae]
MQLSLIHQVVALAPMAGGGGGDDGQGSSILPHTGELVFGLVLFLIFLIYIWKKVVPTIEGIYQQRTEAIEGDMGRAEKALAEAEALKAQYEQQLSEARTEAARVREEAREQGAAIIAEMRDQAQVEAARILENAQRQIEAERNQAMQQLRGDVGQLSTDLASRIVGESLHDEIRQRGIVERFISELEAGRIEPTTASSGDGHAPRDV